MKQIILFLLFFLSANGAFSAYIKNVPVTLKQPDGTVIDCYVSGDEFHRRVHDIDNYTIIQDPVSGYYVYADLINDQLVPTPLIAGQHNPRGLALRPGYDIPPSDMEVKRQSALKSAAAVANNTKGNFNNIVISIRFSDQEPTPLALTIYEENFNSPNDISLKSYFNEVSNNQLNVSSFFFPIPQNGTVLEYKDSYPRAYYMLYNEITNPQGYQGGEGSRRERLLLKNALESVAEQIEASGIDFDSNGDGYIDNVIFIIQGDTDGWGNVLWPMASTFNDNSIIIGGKRAGRYNKQLTAWFSADVLCHEFFHSLGAPDLYRYTHTQIDPVGAWDMMAVTGTQHMTTYMKWKYGKWFDAIPEITAPGTYTLEPVSQNPFASYKIRSPKNTDEYFIVEYRKKEGLLESTMNWSYDEGLIIYRINPNIRGNSQGPPDEVYVYRPDGDETYSGLINSAAFSSNHYRDRFNNETNPRCFLSNGEPGWINISDVSSPWEFIQFTVNDADLFPKPQNFVATEDNGEIVFSWEAPPSTPYALQGYNIYQADDNTPLNQALITGTSFRTSFPGDDPYYRFHLVALYSEGESNPVTLFFSNPGFPSVKDSLALVVLYDRCDGPNWMNNSNWLEGPLNTWYGVTVENGRVTGLQLKGYWYEDFGLKNHLPPQIGDLTALRKLDLSYNDLEGKIPAETGNLENLKELYLTHNNLSGPIPGEMGQLHNLEELDFSNNNLSGPIPGEMGNLKSLRKLTLSFNSLEDGLHPSLWDMEALVGLVLPGNKISRVSEGISRLTNLVTLNLANNLLNGPVPEEIYGMNHLEDLDLSGNSFSGAVLDRISALTNLRKLNLGQNDFTGEMPPVIGTMKNLTYLNLSHNSFSGEIPGEIADLPVLSYLGLADNRFHGAFPHSIAHHLRLGMVDVANNEFYAFPQLHSPVIYGLMVNGNRLTFEDIEILNAITFNAKHPDYFYHNQAKIGKEETTYAPPGKPFVLKVYCGGRLNRYKWYKDGIAVSGTSSSPEFVVENVVPGNNGVYYCEVTNSSASALYIESHPVTLVGLENLIAHAGNDFGADEGTQVVLDGTASYNPGTSSLTYRWTAPEGIKLTGTENARPHFTAPEVDYDIEYIFTLVVNDGTRDSAPDEVAVTIRNGRNAPVANAGTDQVVNSGEIVILDGSGSYDPQEWALTYRWTAPEGIELIGADEVQPRFTAPAVDEDTKYIFILVVNDLTEDSPPDTVTVTVRSLSEAPVADAGPDQMVDEGAQVTLDGSGSVSLSGGALTYHWTAPNGIELTGSGEVQPRFTAPEVNQVTVFVFTLVVNDGIEDSPPDTVTVTVRSLSEAPVADAGPDQMVDEGAQVTLDGSGSVSLSGGALTYHWTAPNGIELTGSGEVQPRFTAPEVNQVTVFVFTLVVNDGIEDSPPDETVVTVRNIPAPPVADAGPGQVVYSGELVTLDGSGSLAPDGDDLFYEWQPVDGITLNSPNEAICTFTAPEFSSDTTMIFHLVVTNRNGDADTSAVEITIKPIVIGTVSVEPGMFIIYPNPSGGIVNLRLQNFESGRECQLSVTTAYGVKVLERQFFYSGIFTFDLSAQPAGIYFIRLTTGNQTYINRLVIM